MGDLVTLMPPPFLAKMALPERCRLAAAHGALAMAQMQAVRASCEYAMSGSVLDKAATVTAAASAMEALAEIILIVSPPRPTEPEDAA